MEEKLCGVGLCRIFFILVEFFRMSLMEVDMLKKMNFDVFIFDIWWY